MIDIIMSASAFEAFGMPVTWLEIVAFITGLACVYGVTKQYLWNWPVGILNNIAFTVLFFGSSLYGESLLQIIFAAVAVYGWYNWLRGGENKSELKIRNISRDEIVGSIVVTIVGTYGVAQILTHSTDSPVPYPDAFILIASLVATWFQAKKVFQHWWVWIAIDIVSIPLYVSRGLILTALLYSIFMGLCFYGLFAWNKDRKAQENLITVAA